MIIFINDSVYNKSRTALDFLWLHNAETECADYCSGSKTSNIFFSYYNRA